MFALDSFAPELTFWQQMAAFGMHMIPSLVLAILLVIAWKWEMIGGAIFTLIGLGLSPFIFLKNYQMNQSVLTSLGVVMLITIPFVVVGVLFLLSYRVKKQQN
jgi:cytochrome b561